MNVRIAPLRAVLLFTVSIFLNGITPFGQVGGDPLTAIVFTRAIHTDFETGLAAIGSLNALHRLAAVCLGLVGISYLGSRIVLPQSFEQPVFIAGGLINGLVYLPSGTADRGGDNSEQLTRRL